MAIPTGTSDERDIYRAMVVQSFSDVSWDEYLRVRSRADDGRDPGARRVVADGGQLEEPALPALHIGDHVQDRDDPDATMIVVGLPVENADEYEVDGTPLTKFNPDYPADDDAVEVVYPDRTDVKVSEKKYAFSRSRLRLEAAIHDRDTSGEEAER